MILPILLNPGPPFPLLFSFLYPNPATLPLLFSFSLFLSLPSISSCTFSLFLQLYILFLLHPSFSFFYLFLPFLSPFLPLLHYQFLLLSKFSNFLFSLFSICIDYFLHPPSSLTTFHLISIIHIYIYICKQYINSCTFFACNIITVYF